MIKIIKIAEGYNYEEKPLEFLHMRTSKIVRLPQRALYWEWVYRLVGLLLVKRMLIFTSTQ